MVRIIGRALAKAPDGRYQTGREMADDLLALTRPGLDADLAPGRGGHRAGAEDVRLAADHQRAAHDPGRLRDRGPIRAGHGGFLAATGPGRAQDVVRLPFPRRPARMSPPSRAARARRTRACSSGSRWAPSRCCWPSEARAGTCSAAARPPPPTPAASAGRRTRRPAPARRRRSPAPATTATNAETPAPAHRGRGHRGSHRDAAGRHGWSPPPNTAPVTTAPAETSAPGAAARAHRGRPIPLSRRGAAGGRP